LHQTHGTVVCYRLLRRSTGLQLDLPMQMLHHHRNISI